MNAIRLTAALALLTLTGCHHFPRQPFSKTVAGHTIKLSHTRMCSGTSEPVEVTFTPAPKGTYSIVNEEDAAVATGAVSEKFELVVKDLPMNRYKIVVPVTETESLEANFEVALCRAVY